MIAATFAHPGLTTFCRLDKLGLKVTGQRLELGRAVLVRRVVGPDQRCYRCGCEGTECDRWDPEAGARAVQVAADRAGDGPAPLPAHRLRVRMASR